APPVTAASIGQDLVAGGWRLGLVEPHVVAYALAARGLAQRIIEWLRGIARAFLPCGIGRRPRVLERGRDSLGLGAELGLNGLCLLAAWIERRGNPVQSLPEFLQIGVQPGPPADRGEEPARQR